MLSSRRHIELVRTTYQGSFLEQGNRLKELLDPEVEWQAAPGFPYGGTYRGLEAVQKHVFEPIARDWDGYCAVVSELLDAGDTVVALGTYYGTFRSTQRSMHASFAHVWTLRGQRIVRFQQVVDSAKMREAM